MGKFKLTGPSLYPNLRRSTSGYRKGSDAVNDKSLVVPSNKISMCEENGDPLEKGNIKGTGLTTGVTIAMKPGKNYEFPGDEEVLETPMAQKDCTCWSGYSRVPGTKPCAKGSCKKNK